MRRRPRDEWSKGRREGGGVERKERRSFCTLEDIFTRIAFAPLQYNTTEIADMFKILDISAVVVS